jgi:hypothetical protein
MKEMASRIGEWLLVGWILLVCGYYLAAAYVASQG